MEMDWEQHYRDAHTPWDKGSPAPPLLEWMEKHPERIQGRVLVPGVGSGHDAAALAEATSDTEIVGIDISPTALSQARATYAFDSLDFVEADLFDLPAQHQGSYDWIWEHTCFCAIDMSLRDDYVVAVHQALRENGQLLAVFYLDPYDEEHRRGEGPPHGSTIDELQERFVTSGRFRLLESYVPDASYPGREGLEQVMRFERVG